MYYIMGDVNLKYCQWVQLAPWLFRSYRDIKFKEYFFIFQYTPKYLLYTIKVLSHQNTSSHRIPIAFGGCKKLYSHHVQMWRCWQNGALMLLYRTGMFATPDDRDRDTIHPNDALTIRLRQYHS